MGEVKESMSVKCGLMETSCNSVRRFLELCLFRLTKYSNGGGGEGSQSNRRTKDIAQSGLTWTEKLIIYFRGFYAYFFSKLCSYYNISFLNVVGFVALTR